MIEDSDRRCPFDGKRLLVEIGQDDTSGDHQSGLVRSVHFCLHCDYREIEENWPRPRIPVHSGPTMAEQLHKARTEGWVVPFRYDLPEVEDSEWDEAG